MAETIKNLIFVDCEAYGKSLSIGVLTEFGAVAYPSRDKFHGILAERSPVVNSSPAMPRKLANDKEVFEKFEQWLLQVTNHEHPILVSDNPAFDWQWINDGFWRTIGRNPFGHSARRIGDFYAVARYPEN